MNIVPEPVSVSINLKQVHLQAGLNPLDLQYLDAAPLTASRRGQTFRGISIE